MLYIFYKGSKRSGRGTEDTKRRAGGEVASGKGGRLQEREVEGGRVNKW